MKLFFLIARPRSGTTVFRDILSACSNTYAIGEIFSDDPNTKPLPFVPWFAQRVAWEPALSVPTGKNRAQLLREYIAFLDKQRPELYCASPTIVSVNYNSLHILNTVWQNSYDAPYLCRLITDLNCGVIHMVRRNMLRTLVSEYRAKQTNIWHLTSENRNKLEGADIRIDVDNLLYELTMRAQEIETIGRFFRDYERRHTIYYEDLFDSAVEPRESEIARVLTFIGAHMTSRIGTRFCRTSSKELASDISNWPDVVQRLEGTPFAAMLWS
jgi:Stf0 sulphotransferase